MYNILFTNHTVVSFIWKPISAKTRYILQWMKCVSHEKRCIFQKKRCIFQLVRCIIPIWWPPDISGGRHLENEMYISSTKIYISTGEIYYSYLVAARYIWRPPLRE